jgi:hypothetical protein
MKHIYFYILFLIAAQSISAQVTFKTAVSKDELGLNERLRIEFSINKQGGDDFTPPNFRNFKVLAGPSQATSFSSINGKSSFKQTYTYIIQPNKKGTFTIPSASITYKGQIIKSNTVRIRVTDAIAIPIDPNDPRYMASQNIHLVAELSNSNPYVGESISVVYKLYVNTNKVNVQNTRELSSPTFTGFWNQNIKVERWVAQNGTYKGEPHRYVIVKKSLLIPHKSGKLELEPLEMEITAGVPMGRRDFFGNMMFNDVNFTLTSGKRVINVKPLPEQNKPVNFNGAVGNYDFSVTTSKTMLKANESATLVVSVSGKGNLKLIELPSVIAPKGLEVYEPEHHEKIRTSLNGLQGKIYDQYALVPQFKGKFKIPEVSFSFFNPAEGQYHTITSDAIIINVPQGPSAANEDDGTNLITKRTVVGGGNDIRFIKIKTKLVPEVKEEDFYGSNLYYILLLLPLLSIPTGIFLGKKKQDRDNDIVGNKRRKANRLARKYLSEAKKQLGNKEPFYEALERAIHNYLKARFQVETSEMNMDRIVEMLTERNVDANTITEFKKVIDDSNLARYAPSTSTVMKQDFNRAKQVIAKLDKYLS